MLDYADLLKPIVGRYGTYYEGEHTDEVLKAIEPPSGMMIAYKVVGLYPAVAKWKPVSIPAMAYPSRKEYAFNNLTCHFLTSRTGDYLSRMFVTYVPGKTTYPRVPGSMLFSYQTLAAATTSLHVCQAIYRCFVPIESRKYDRVEVPLLSNGNAGCIGYWLGQYSGHLDFSHVNDTVLSSQITLMNRISS